MTTLELFNLFLAQPSYDTWRDAIRVIEGQPPANREVWNVIAGGRAPLTAPPAELFAAVGRGAGKTQVSSIIAVGKALAYGGRGSRDGLPGRRVARFAVVRGIRGPFCDPERKV